MPDRSFYTQASGGARPACERPQDAGRLSGGGAAELEPGCLARRFRDVRVTEVKLDTAARRPTKQSAPFL